MKRNPYLTMVGITLVALGLWLLALQLGLALPEPSHLWPILVVLTGLAALLRFGSSREPDQLFLAAASILSGGFLLLFSLGRLDWSDLSRLWPAFLIIFGLASAVESLAVRERHGLLVRAGLALLLGLFLLAFDYGLLNSGVARQALQFWPLLLVGAGLVALARGLRRAH